MTEWRSSMKYRAITSENFYFLDIKRVAKAIICEEKEIKDVREYLIHNRLLETISEHNQNKKLLTIIKRLKQLDKVLLGKLAEEDSSIGKFLNLYSILLGERLFLEFMNDIIKERYFSFDYYINEKDFLKYINLKGETAEDVRAWSEATKKKMAVKLKGYFIEAGYLIKDSEEQLKISRPVIPKEIREHIKEIGNSKLLEIMLYRD